MNLDEAQRLIQSLSESRAVEVKRWFDPREPSGKAKLVKGLQALRNFNGGALVVGFDNDTLAPDLANYPADVTALFHADKVQEVVSHYTSQPFEVEVQLPELDGRVYPVIAVPAGVQVPVAARRDLNDGQGAKLISCDDVYFRTLQTNNRVSSAKIPYKDWPELMSICFDNREADIGRFLRRHLGDMTPSLLRDLVGALGAAVEPDPDIDTQLFSFLDAGKQRFSRALADRETKLGTFGTFEVALIIAGGVPPRAVDREFLRLLDGSNPQLTGWPIWLDSAGFRNESSRPYVLDGGWEALVISDGSDMFSPQLDFMRKEPSGRFYLLRALQDDLSGSDKAPLPGTALDFGLAILRTAEAIAVGRAFSGALGCDPEDTMLEFVFRWSGLKGRVLSSWANPERYLSVDRRIVQDEVVCRTTVPLISASDAIVTNVYEVVACLFQHFDGFVIAKSVVEDLVARLLERRL